MNSYFHFTPNNLREGVRPLKVKKNNNNKLMSRIILNLIYFKILNINYIND